MGKSRQSANLVSDNNIFVDIVNDRVGMGTTSPQYKLHVIGDININGSINQNGNPFAAAGWSSGLGDDIYRLNGDVGIGTTNPAYKLDVNGDINFNGTLNQNGSVFVSSKWTSATGDNIYKLNGNVGIGTTNPTKPLHIYTADGDVRIGDITEGTASTDAGIIFTGLGANTSAMFTEVDGTILSYGINCQQITGVDTARSGGVFRLDTRILGSYGDSNCFVVKGRPIGTTTEYNAVVIGLNDGNTYLSPIRGNVLVSSATSTGTASQNLQVTGGAYVSGNLGLGHTNPTAKLDVVGNVNIDNGTAADANPELRIAGNGYIDFHSILSAGAYNPITSLNDKGIIFSDGSPGTGNFIIAPWSASAAGIKINNSGNVLVGSGTSTGTASQNLQVTGGAYVSGNVGVGTTNPSAKLDVIGDVNITGSMTAPDIGELYQLDDISFFINGTENTFVPRFNCERVAISDPFKLIISVNGLLQPAYFYNKEYVHASYCLSARKGYTIDEKGDIKFTTPIGIGSEVIIRTASGKTRTNAKQYPFPPLEIMF